MPFENYFLHHKMRKKWKNIMKRKTQSKNCTNRITSYLLQLSSKNQPLDGSVLRSVLLAYKYLDDAQFIEDSFQEFFKFYEKDPDLEKFFRIFFENFLENSELSSENLHKHLEIFLSSQLKENTMSTYQNIKLEGKLEGELLSDKKTAKRLWQKQLNVVFIAEAVDRPIELIKEWIFAFEKEGETENG